jgi:chaperonin cofactor prefoldin
MNPELQKIEKYITSLGFLPKTFTELSQSNGGKSLVTDNNTAFCFDDISDYFWNKKYNKKLSSADALLLKDSLYLIEFKFMSPQSSVISRLQSVISQYQSVATQLSKHLSIIPSLQSVISQYQFAISQIQSLVRQNQSMRSRLKSMISQLKEINNLPEKMLKLKLFKKMVESIRILQECIFINNQINSTGFKKHFIIVTDNAVQSTSAGYKRMSRNKSNKNSVYIFAMSDIFEFFFDEHLKNAPKNNRIKIYYDSVDIWNVNQFSKKVALLK